MGCIFSKCEKTKDREEEFITIKDKLIPKNKIEDYVEETINKMREDVLKKEQKLNEKEKSLKENEDKQNEKEKEIINKLNERDGQLNIKEKSLNDKESKLNIKDNEMNIKEKILKEKEDKQINKEKILIDKEQKLIAKDNDINLKEKSFNEKKEKINKEIDDKNKSLIEKENKLNKEIQDKQKENNDKEQSLKNEFINLEKQKKDFEKENKLVQDKKNEIIVKEQNLKKEFLILENQKQEFEKEKQLENLPILVGLNNIGATCYMNSTLQAFSNTDKLTDYFLNSFKYNPNDESKKMSNEYYKLIINLWDKHKTNSSFSPDDFKTVLSKENPLFQGIKANDSKDLINFLLERLHLELNNPIVNANEIDYNNINQLNEMESLNGFLQDYRNKFRSIISDLFYGVLETKCKCTMCQTIKFNFQIYSFLEFPLPEVNNFCFNNGRRISLLNNDGTNPDIDLYECFDYYQRLEFMTGDNRMYCNICNAILDSYYSTSLYSLPNYLIINLNRGKNAYYQCKVHFPEQLNLINYVSFKNGITVYKLYAVICHYGESSMSGHFMAFCRNRKDNNLYLFNDGMVSKCTQQYQYNNGMPYILFYKAA